MEAVAVASTKCLPSLSRPMRSRRTAVVMAAIKRSNSYGSGRLVDESLIVLRKRIHEMKVIERNYQPPSHWMDWEKQIYANYDDIICRSIGAVQSQLIDARPSVAIAALGLVAASVPTSVILLTMQIASVLASASGH